MKWLNPPNSWVEIKVEVVEDVGEEAPEAAVAVVHTVEAAAAAVPMEEDEVVEAVAVMVVVEVVDPAVVMEGGEVVDHHTTAPPPLVGPTDQNPVAVLAVGSKMMAISISLALLCLP